MLQDVRAMLETTYSIIEEKAERPLEAWDRFIDFLAVNEDFCLFMRLNHKFEWLFGDRELTKKLTQAYDPVLLRSDYHDHLGDMYRDKIQRTGLVDRRARALVSTNVADATVCANISETQHNINILDENAGTGRILMAAHKRAPNAGLYGLEMDVRKLRIAYTNFAIPGPTRSLFNSW